MQASLDRQRLFGAIAVGGVVLLSTPMFWQHTVGYFDSGTQEKLNEFVSFPAGLVSAIFGLLWFRDARVPRPGKANLFGMRRWRLSLFASRGLGGLKASATTQSIDNEWLMGAFHLADHSPAVKVGIAKELQARGFSQDQFTGWVLPPERITVPSPVRVIISREKYAALISLWTAAWLLLCFLLILSSLPFVLLLSAAFFDISDFFGKHPASLRIVDYYAQLGPHFLFSGIFVALLTCLLARNRSARILLLRPFGNAQMTRALKKVVLRKLGTVGHVYTLSDRNFKWNAGMEVLAKLIGVYKFFFAPAIRPSFRIASISDEVSFFRLASRLYRRFRPGFLGFISGGQAFNLRSTDKWWKQCIDLMMHSCELIVMDISRVSEGSAWEIVELRRRGLMNKCIFIVQEEFKAEADQTIANILPLDRNIPLHVFRKNGVFIDGPAFDRQLSDHLSEAVTDFGKPSTESIDALQMPQPTAATVASV